MKFGKEFGIHLEETLPEWRDKYLCYKPLKKLLKNIPAADPPKDGDGLAAQLPSAELHDWFVGILNEELEKFNDFFVDKEEEFIIRFQQAMEPDIQLKLLPRTCLKDQMVFNCFNLLNAHGMFGVFSCKILSESGYIFLKELKERIERVKEEGSRDGVFRSDTEFSEEMMDIRRDFVAIHGEMVLLKNYSSLNFAGLLKILKKYDKRTGGLLRLPFTQLAVHQPFFTTEPLTRLVHECEENLELLFPLEAEVVESTSVAQDQMDTVPSNSSNDCLETTLSLGEETVDIYRSTLAAMRAIKGLKKASSTCNPLSFSSLFGNLDNDNTGTVTAANSPCDSFATLQNGDEANEDVADAPK